MTGKERVQGAIERTPIDRIPLYCDEMFINTARRWQGEGMPPSQAEQEDFFDWDCTELFVDSSLRFEERVLDETNDQWTVADKHGFIAKRNKTIPGIEYLEHPLKAMAEWPRLRRRWKVSDDTAARVHEISYFVPFITWPTWTDAKAIFDRKRATGRHITLRAYGHWEILWRLRGFEQAMMDIVLEPQNVKEIFDDYSAFLLDVLASTLRHGIHVDSFFLVDDHGANNGLLFSPDFVRRMIIPQYKKLSALLKANDIYLFLHSCGKVQELIPDYLKVGIIGLNPLQATAMNVADLKKEYGDSLTFIGNINSRTMHDAEAVKKEILHKLPVASRGGGYIFAVDHSVPGTVSLQAYQDILNLVKAVPVCP